MGSLSGEVRTEVLCGHICDLEAENAKLRELVRDYYIYEHRDCDSCRFYDDCHSVGCASRAPFCIAPIRLGERARELGVEVD